MATQAHDMATHTDPDQDQARAPGTEQDAGSDRRTLVLPAGIYVDTTGASRGPEPMAATVIAEGRVRWGAVWAGLVAALTVFVLLGLLGLTIGLSHVNVGAMVASGKAPRDAGRNAAIWAGAAGIIAFLIGGYVAGRMAMVFTRGQAALHGAMIFFLTVPVIVLPAVLDLSGNLGTVGKAIHDNLRALHMASSGTTARNVVLWALIGLVVMLVASTLGGALGARRPQYHSQVRGRIT
ncbi:MAG TPA: hypothetical protein VHB98_18145 [Chloroflexota bacterium]|nr:hypothetical protein [Chloroflexota bacterium]